MARVRIRTIMILVMVMLVVAVMLAAAACAPKTGALSIDSTPDGAEVYVDGAFAGKTPLKTAEIKPGRHVVRVVLTGHTPFEATVEVQAGKTSEVAARLLKDVFNPVLVESDPEGAAVYVDGRFEGNTPAVIEKPASEVPIVLFKPGYAWTVHYYSIQESRRSLSFKMRPAQAPSEASLRAAAEKVTPPALVKEQDSFRVGPFASAEPRVLVPDQENQVLLQYTVPLEGFEDWSLDILAVYDLALGTSRVLRWEPSHVLNDETYTYATRGLTPLGWLDRDTLLLAVTRSRSGRSDDPDLGLGVEKINIAGGKTEQAGWFPLYLKTAALSEWWLSPAKDALYYVTYRASGEVFRMELGTGAITQLKSSVPLAASGGYPAVRVDRTGEKLISGEWTPGYGIWVSDLKTGTSRMISPTDAVYDRVSWSPDGKRLALVVGETGMRHELLPGENGDFLLGSSIWLFDSAGLRSGKLTIPGKMIGYYEWAQDSASLYVMACRSEKVKDGTSQWPWRLVGDGVYRVYMDGKVKIVEPSRQGEMYEVKALKNGWIAISSWESRETGLVSPTGTAAHERGEVLGILADKAVLLQDDTIYLLDSAGIKTKMMSFDQKWGWPWFEDIDRYLIFLSQGKPAPGNYDFWLTVVPVGKR